MKLFAFGDGMGYAHSMMIGGGMLVMIGFIGLPSLRIIIPKRAKR